MTINFEISPEYIRWFFKPIFSEKEHSNYEPFTGNDSALIETKYRAIFNKAAPTTRQEYLQEVRGGLFEVDLQTQTCSPVYWSGDRIPNVPESRKWRSATVLRGTWFRSDNWHPLSENLANFIETAYTEDTFANLINNEDETKPLEGRIYASIIFLISC